MQVQLLDITQQISDQLHLTSRYMELLQDTTKQQGGDFVQSVKHLFKRSRSKVEAKCDSQFDPPNVQRDMTLSLLLRELLRENVGVGVEFCSVPQLKMTPPSAHGVTSKRICWHWTSSLYFGKIKLHVLKWRKWPPVLAALRFAGAIKLLAVHCTNKILDFMQLEVLTFWRKCEWCLHLWKLMLDVATWYSGVLRVFED